MKFLQRVCLGILVGGILFLVGCASGPTATQADEFRKAVEETFATYTAANVKGDVDLYLSLWDENGVKMSPGKPAIFGKKAIGEGKRKSAEKWTYVSQNVKVEETQLFGNFGFARGTYTTSSKATSGGATSEANGKFLTIFKKQADGTWKIYRDCVNSNVP